MTDIPREPSAKRKINLPPEPQPAAPPPRAAASPQPAPRNAASLNQSFIICFAVGTVLALAGHWPGFELLGLIGPVVMTMIYPLWGMATVRRHPSLRERLADNSYYLGFIFTQVALFMAFAVPVISGRSVGGDDIMRGFGVAIGASMTGLLVRTLIMQTSHSAAENADIVEEGVEALAREVEDLTRGVSRHTRTMLNDLQGMAEDLSLSRLRFSDEMRQWVEETSSRLNDFDAALQGQLDATRKGAGRVADAADGVEADLKSARTGLTERLVETLTALRGMREGLEARVAETAKSVGESADDFRKGMAAVGEMQATLQGRIADTTGVIQTAAERLSVGLNALRGMTSVDDLVGSLNQRAERVGAGVDRLSEVVADAAGRTQDASNRGVSEISAASQRGALAMDAVAGEGLARLRQANDEGLQKAQAQLGEELNQAVKALEAVLGDFRRELERVRV